MSQHTSGPWEVAEYDAAQVEVCGPKELHVAFCNNSPMGRANATFIVRAVNCHDDLLVALKNLMAVQDCDTDCWCDELASHEHKKCEACEARAAIAKAEGHPAP